MNETDFDYDEALPNHNAATLLHLRFMETGNYDELNGAILLERKALALLLENKEPDRVTYQLVLNTLSTALISLYEFSGATQLLDEAIEYLSYLRDCPDSGDGKTIFLNHLARAFKLKFEASGNIDYITRYLEYQREADALTPPGGPGKLARRANLGLSLLEHYELTHKIQSLEEAISILEEVVSSYKTGPIQILNNLSIALSYSYKLNKFLPDLIRAIEYQTRIVESIDPNNPEKVNYLISIGSSYEQLYKHTNNTDDLIKAKDFYQEAYDAEITSKANEQLSLYNLARIYGVLHKNINDKFYFEKALEHYYEALDAYSHQFDKYLNLLVTFFVFLFDNELWADCIEQYQRIIEVRDYLYHHHEDLSAKLIWLRQAQHITSMVAYAYIYYEAYDEAIEILEEHSAVLFSDALNKDIAEIQVRYRDSDTKRDELNEEISKCVAIMEELWLEEPADSKNVQKARCKYFRLQRKAEQFENNISYLDINDIRVLAKDEPIVYLFATPKGGKALVVLPDNANILAVNIPELTTGSVGPETIYIDAQRGEITNTLLGMGLKVTFPILQTIVPHYRAVIIPVGVTSYLPLHATIFEANLKFEECKYFLDLIGFRYVPNARSLMITTEKVNTGTLNSYLGIASTEDESGLHYAVSEVREASIHFPISSRTILIGKKEANWEVLQHLLNKYSVIHFACHGLKEEDPLSSGLVHNNESSVLRVADLLSLPKLNTRLAILSACESGVRSGNLPEEVISLPAIFMQAGVSGVISTLWPIHDKVTYLIMGQVYKYIQEGYSPSESLRFAQLWMRFGQDPNFHPAKKYIPRRPAEYNALSDEAKQYCHPFFWGAFFYMGV